MKKKTSLLDVVKQAEADANPDKCEVKESGDECSLTYYGSKIETVEDLIKSAKIDLSIWEVVEKTVNNWEVAGKRRMGQNADKLWQPDRLWKTGLRQIKVKLRRLAPKPIQDAIAGLLKSVKTLAPRSKPKIADGDTHMVELGIYDHHWGKYAWGKVTGTNWDLDIADREFRQAIDEMIARSASFNVEQFVLPVGNDWFHVNDWLSQTANGTRVESVDDRFEKVFRAGCSAMQYAVERCIQIAPLKVVFVPGNHDRHSSWFMIEWLGAIFRDEPLVEIDSSPRSRKYLSYGAALLGYAHGELVPHRELPAMMANEAPQQWAASKFRSWRLGHLHTRRETRYVAGDTINGVEVRIFPSMCGTDQWHYDHGFIGNGRMAECHVWSKSSGPVGHFVVHAKECGID